jgi:tRNA threonylcarbamoyladenosine modification (KEOPS) complex Cgi121 subunit
LKVFAKAYSCGPETNPEALKLKLSLANPGSLVQSARGRSAVNEFFVEMLAAQTIRAEDSGGLLAKKPEIDLLLRLAGTNQISTAIKEKGARNGEAFLLICAGRSAPKSPKGLQAKELPRRELSRTELARVEKAALLGIRNA